MEGVERPTGEPDARVGDRAIRGGTDECAARSEDALRLGHEPGIVGDVLNRLQGNEQVIALGGGQVEHVGDLEAQAVASLPDRLE